MLSTAGCSGRDVPEVRAKPQPAGLSKETVRLSGQEPSVLAILSSGGCSKRESVTCFIKEMRFYFRIKRREFWSNLAWRLR